MSTSTQELVQSGVDPSELTSVDRDDAIKIIRDALKKRSGKTWSVTGGKGSAWGWIEITAPPKRRVAHTSNPAYNADEARQTRDGRDLSGNLPHIEIAPDDRHGAYYMSEADRAELAALLGLDYVHHQGESIPAASDYRRQYIAMALGKTPLSVGQRYWD